MIKNTVYSFSKSIISKISKQWFNQNSKISTWIAKHKSKITTQISKHRQNLVAVDTCAHCCHLIKIWLTYFTKKKKFNGLKFCQLKFFFNGLNISWFRPNSNGIKGKGTFLGEKCLVFLMTSM